MGVLTLNPVSYYNFGRGSWGSSFSSGTPAVNIVNSTNGEYARLNSNYTSGSNGASLKYRVGSAQLPAGAKVQYMRPAYVVRSNLVTNETNFRGMIQNIRGGNGKGQNSVTWSGQLRATAAFSTIYGVAEKTTKSNNRVYGDGSITQTDINNLVIEIFDIVSTNIQIDRMYIEVFFDAKPTITINTLGIVSETTNPVITFDYDDDQMPLDAVDVEIYQGSTLIHSDSKFSLDSPSYPVPVPLDDGVYTVKMRAYQQWNYAGDAPVSNWDTEDFTVAIGRPGVPTIDATAEPANARVRIDVQPTLNLLATDAAEGMPSGWNDVYNGFVNTGNVFQTTGGDRSLRVEFNNTDTFVQTFMTGQLIPVTAGNYYAWSASARPYSGDSPVTFNLGIRWINAVGGTVADNLSTSFLEVAGGWKQGVLYQQAPVGAVFAKPFIKFNGNTAGAWHYVDSLLFVVQPSFAAPLPAWSRGGFTQDTTINLLSYGDSSLEGISHWTPVIADPGDKEGLVSVVNAVLEPGVGSNYRYQGENILKATTSDTLIKRDVQSNTSATTTISVSKGATNSGDTMLAFVIVQGNTTTVATPSGWTLVNLSTGTTHRVYCFVKYASGEPSTLTWTASASGKHAVILEVWSGVDFFNPIDSYSSTSPVASVGANTPVSLNNVNVPHNAPVIQGFFGRSTARTTAMTFTSNLGGNQDAVVSTTANTAAEVQAAVFSRKYNTGMTTNLSLTGRTITANAATTDVMTWNVVLRPDRSTVRATLKDYEYYDYDNANSYVVYAGVYGATSTSGVNSANRAINFIVDLYDESKVFIQGYIVGSTTAAIGDWKKLTGILNVNQPTAKYMTIRLEIDQMTDYEAYYFDAISLYPSTTNLGYVEGFRDVDGPYSEAEYSEDGGITWQTTDDTDSLWMAQRITDFTTPSITFNDYEVAAGVERIYRFFNWKMIDGYLVESDYSNTDSAEIDLKRSWMHVADDPAGSIYQFQYDGNGKDDSFDKDAVFVQFAGREYPQAYYSENSNRDISGTVQVPTGPALEALKRFARTKELVIFRDGRGNRVKGHVSIDITYEPWGATGNIKIKVVGLQP